MSDDPSRDQPIASGAGHDPVEDALAAAAAEPIAIDDARLASLEARVMTAVGEADDRRGAAVVGGAIVPLRRRRGVSSLRAGGGRGVGARARGADREPARR